MPPEEKYGATLDRQASLEYNLGPSEAIVQPAAEAAKKDPVSFSDQIKANQAKSMLYKAPAAPQPGVPDSVVFKKDAKVLSFGAPADGLQPPKTDYLASLGDTIGNDIPYNPIPTTDLKAKLAETAPKKEPGGKFDQKNHDKSEMTIKTLSPDVIAKVGDPEIKEMLNQIVNPKTNEADTVALTRALQGKLQTGQDGAFGPKSLAALQAKYPPAAELAKVEIRRKKLTPEELAVENEKVNKQYKAIAEFVNKVPQEWLVAMRKGLEVLSNDPKQNPTEVEKMEQTIAMVDMRLAGKTAMAPTLGAKAPTEQMAAKTAVDKTAAASTEGIKA